MASPGGVVAAVRADFDSRFGGHATASGVQILHDGDPPLGEKAGTTDPHEDPRNAEWVRVAFNFGSGETREIGSRESEQLGRMTVAIHVPAYTGDARAWALADLVRDLYQRQDVGGASFREVEPAVLGVSLDNRWFQMNAEVAFSFENTPA